MRWTCPVLKSKPDRASSIVPKLYLRQSADVSDRLIWSGQVTCLRISTKRCSFKLHFDQRDASRMLLQRHAEARRIGTTFPVRPPPAYAAYHRRRPLVALVNRPTRMAGRAEAPGISCRRIGHRAVSDGPSGPTYTSVELKRWHTRFSFRSAGLTTAEVRLQPTLRFSADILPERPGASS